MLASAVLTKAKKILNDEGVSWPESELLGWLNDGRREVVKIRPDANTVRETVQLAAGTAQTLSSDCIALIDITRNMGTDGTAPGKAIIAMSKDVFDRWRPNWHTAIASATVDHFIINKLTPREYSVFPPQPSSDMGYVERIVSKSPADIAVDADIVLGDQWVVSLVDYICGRAHAKDAGVSESSKSVLHMTNFYKGLEV